MRKATPDGSYQQHFEDFMSLPVLLNSTKEKLINTLIEFFGAWENHQLCGTALWFLIQGSDGIFYIGCFILKEYKIGWGFEVFRTERAGPFHVNCPLRFLDVAPVTNEEWRAKVRAHHAKQAT